MSRLLRKFGMPWKGFVGSKAKQQLRPDEISADSRDWLVDPQEGKLLRRKGSVIVGDDVTAPLGLLETKYSAKSRQVVSLSSPTLVDGYPTHAVLYTNETSKKGQLYFYDTNANSIVITAGVNDKLEYKRSSAFADGSVTLAAGTYSGQSVMEEVERKILNGATGGVERAGWGFHVKAGWNDIFPFRETVGGVLQPTRNAQIPAGYYPTGAGLAAAVTVGMNAVSSFTNLVSHAAGIFTVATTTGTRLFILTQGTNSGSAPNIIAAEQGTRAWAMLGAEHNTTYDTNSSGGLGFTFPYARYPGRAWISNGTVPGAPEGFLYGGRSLSCLPTLGYAASTQSNWGCQSAASDLLATANQTIGQSYSNQYPAAGAATPNNFKMIPLWTELSTIYTRCVTAAQRAMVCSGARNVLQIGDWLFSGNLTGTPMKWNKTFNDTVSATNNERIFPAGNIPPLWLPDLTIPSSSTVGTEPWTGKDRFFYSVLFKHKDGSYSMPFIPRATNAILTSGYGLFTVNSGNTALRFAYVTWTNIPIGTSDVTERILCRSTKADASLVPPGVPSLGDLRVTAIIRNNTQTTYTDYNGNDNGLEANTVVVRYDHIWPPRARYLWAFDHRIGYAYTKQNPAAILLTQKNNLNGALDAVASRNLADEDVGTRTFTRVQTTSGSAVVTAGAQSFVGLTVGLAVSGTGIPAATTILTAPVSPWTSMTLSANCTATSTGPDHITMTVTMAESAFAVRENQRAATYVPKELVTRDNTTYATAPIALADTKTIQDVVDTLLATTVLTTTTAAANWKAQLVPGADGNITADNLEYTQINMNVSCAASTTLTARARGDTVQGDFANVVVGMTVQQFTSATGVTVTTNIAAGTTVVSVNTSVSPNTMVITPAATGTVNPIAVRIGWDFGDLRIGEPRAFSNAWPGILYFKKAFLDLSGTASRDVVFTIGSPGNAPMAANSTVAFNRRTLKAEAGICMGGASLLNGAVIPGSKAIGVLRNTKAGKTGLDEDYRLELLNETRGCLSSASLVEGDGWVGYLTFDGYVVTDGEREVVISRDVYHPKNLTGEWAYEIQQGRAGTAADTDLSYFSARAMGGRLYCTYRSSSNVSYPDRQIVYDYSEGTAASGLAEVLRADGSPYGWSAPVTLSLAALGEVNKADGVHRYGTLDSNAGSTGDGRVDEYETGANDQSAASVFTSNCQLHSGGTTVTSAGDLTHVSVGALVVGTGILEATTVVSVGPFQTAFPCTIDGTTTVTTSGSFANLLVGMVVAGSGIPSDTTIAAIASATSLTLSTAATGSGAPVLQFASAGYAVTLSAPATATSSTTTLTFYGLQVEPVAYTAFDFIETGKKKSAHKVTSYTKKPSAGLTIALARDKSRSAWDVLTPGSSGGAEFLRKPMELPLIARSAKEGLEFRVADDGTDSTAPSVWGFEVEAEILDSEN